MTYYLIFTPNPHFYGERAGVLLNAGGGLTLDPRAAADCRRMGYIVRETDNPDGINPIVIEQTTPAPEPPEPKPSHSRRGRGRSHAG